MSYAWLYNAVVLFFLSVVFWATHDKRPVDQELDCTMLVGGWHPDVPREVREGCRFPNKMT